MGIICLNKDCVRCTPFLKKVQVASAITIALALIGLITVAAINIESANWTIIGPSVGGVIFVGTAILLRLRHTPSSEYHPYTGRFDDIDFLPEEDEPDLPPAKSITTSSLSFPESVTSKETNEVTELPSPSIAEKTHTHDETLTQTTSSSLGNATSVTKENNETTAVAVSLPAIVEKTHTHAETIAQTNLTSVAEENEISIPTPPPLDQSSMIISDTMTPPLQPMIQSPKRTKIVVDFARLSLDYDLKAEGIDTKTGPKPIIKTLYEAITDIANAINNAKPKSNEIQIHRFQRSLISYNFIGINAFKHQVYHEWHSWFHQILKLFKDMDYIQSFQNTGPYYKIVLKN